MLVSVIIPTYNAASFVDNTLQSVLKQSYTNIEILVVDDGSNDNTQQVIESYNDPRIQFHPREHQGAPGHCRNYGYTIAQGETIIYLDSDDYMEPNMIEEMVKCYQESEVDLVICQPRYYDVVNHRIVSNEQEKFFAQDTYTLSDLFEINPFPCNKMYRKSFLEQSGVLYLERVFNQDLGYFLSLVFHKPRFTICKKELMEYRIRPNSITTSSRTRKKHMDILHVFDQVFAEYEKTKSYELHDALEKMFIRTMLFKISFFDLLSEKENVLKIRAYLYEHSPKWYAAKGFKEYYSTVKQVYNRLLVQYQLYTPIGIYKKIKRGA